MTKRELPRLSYKQKVFLFGFLLFILFGGAFAFLYKSTEQQQKKEYIGMRANECALFIHAYLQYQKLPAEAYELPGTQIDQAIRGYFSLLPDYWRFTIINEAGNVLCDNDIPAGQPLDSHANRPEVKKARATGAGFVIRRSDTLHKEYYYLAKRFTNSDGRSYYIRVALPYSRSYTPLAQSHSNMLIFFFVFLFFCGLLMLLLFTDKISRGTQALKEFILQANKNKNGDYTHIPFPKGELGEIGEQITETFHILAESNHRLQIEREKLIQHFSNSDEGVAFFSEQNELLYTNSHFVQNLNIIADEKTFHIDSRILSYNELAPVSLLITKEFQTDQKEANTVRYMVEKQGMHVEVRGQLFPDKSFEIVMINVTKKEQNRRLKHEMTNSIAHELRTPVSCVRGYMETLITNPDLPEDKKILFLNRSYDQLLRLSQLISDVSEITKLEEAAELYTCDTIHPAEVVQEVIAGLDQRLKQQDMTFKNLIPIENTVYANHTLLYTIFSNLAENSIFYAGKGTTIEVSLTMQDERFCYYTFADNGSGISDETVDLSRLFDRFYRVSESRSRADGGSGLGLSLVKNAVHFHGGEISVKKRPQGGLEFFFSISKEPTNK